MLGISFEQLRFILHGAGWTLLLSLIGFAGALLGLPLALLRSRGARLARHDGRAHPAGAGHSAARPDVPVLFRHQHRRL